MADDRIWEPGDTVFNGWREGRVLSATGDWVWVDFKAKDGPLTMRHCDLTAEPTRTGI